MNDAQVTGTSNSDPKQTGTYPPVMQQPQPVFAHVITGPVPNPNQTGPIPVYQNGYHGPVIMSNGIYATNPMATQMMNIPEYRTWSILNILFCFLPLGVVACIKSSETRNRKWSGDFHGALQASKSAKCLNICATVIGTIIIIVLVVLAATKTIQFSSYSYYA